MDPILDLLVQAFGKKRGRLICGAYRLAQTATGEAQKREDAEAALQKLQEQMGAAGGHNAALGLSVRTPGVVAPDAAVAAPSDWNFVGCEFRGPREEMAAASGGGDAAQGEVRP